MIPSSVSAFIFTSMVAVTLSHLGPSDYLLVVGTIAFALSSLRAGRMKVLRETNADLKERNSQLETSTTHMLAEARLKDAEIAALQKRPTLDTQEKLMEKLLERLQRHDEAAARAASASQEVFKEIVTELRFIHSAVVPPR